MQELTHVILSACLRSASFYAYLPDRENKKIQETINEKQIKSKAGLVGDQNGLYPKTGRPFEYPCPDPDAGRQRTAGFSGVEPIQPHSWLGPSSHIHPYFYCRSRCKSTAKYSQYQRRHFHRSRGDQRK